MNPTSKASSMRLLALALLPVAALALAQRGPALAPPAAGDLVVGQLAAGVRAPAAEIERLPLTYFQPLAADTPWSPRPRTWPRAANTGSGSTATPCAPATRWR